MDTFSPSCQLLYKMTLLSDQRFEQSVCLLWFRPCHFVSEPPFVFHQDSGLVWDPSSAPGNNIWWWWRSLRDSILMCDPSCALGNDRAAGISFIHEQWAPWYIFYIFSCPSIKMYSAVLGPILFVLLFIFSPGAILVARVLWFQSLVLVIPMYVHQIWDGNEVINFIEEYIQMS